MKIIGIDPGLASTGWGIIEISDTGNVSSFLASGCIHTSPKSDIVSRLNEIYDGLSGICAEFSPEEASIEKLFFAKNTKTALDVAQARGVSILAMFHSRTGIVEYTPLQIKQAVVGYGRADKKQINFMVGKILDVDKSLSSEHETDALAAAICHSHSRNLNKLL